MSHLGSYIQREQYVIGVCYVSRYHQCEDSTDKPLERSERCRVEGDFDLMILLMARSLARLMLALGMIVLSGNLTCCSNVQIIPGDEEDTAQECIQMREKLTNDKTVTPAQAAEIRKNMEKAGCARRF